jgi:hypothetical protein
MRVEDAVALRAVDALNQELLAGEHTLRLGAADRTLRGRRRRSDDSSGNDRRATKDNTERLWHIDTPEPRTRVNWSAVDPMCIIVRAMPRLF